MTKYNQLLLHREINVVFLEIHCDNRMVCVTVAVYKKRQNDIFISNISPVINFIP
jgi:hypothetical protein